MKANVITKHQLHNPENRLAIAHNALTNALNPPIDFFIERTALKDTDVEVYYIDRAILESGQINDDDWKECRINLGELEHFVGIEFRGDSRTNYLSVYQFIDDNLHQVVKAYIEAGKEILPL